MELCKGGYFSECKMFILLHVVLIKAPPFKKMPLLNRGSYYRNYGKGVSTYYSSKH